MELRNLNALQHRFIANNGYCAENGYFRDQLWKQLSRQVRVPTPATCDNRNRYVQAL